MITPRVASVRPRPRRTPGPSPQPPAGRFLRNPSGYLRGLAHHGATFLAGHGVAIIGAAVCATAVYFGLRHAAWRWRHTRLARGARQITVLPPPEVDAAAAHEFWANLTGLLRPAYKRLLAGQPHLAWEYTWTTHTLQIRIWVPGHIPPGMVEHAVEAAWPAARTQTTSPPTDPLPPDAVPVGGALRLARPDHFPLRTDHPADPLRPLMGATAGMPPGQHAVVQILTRPATGRRLRRAHRAAAALRGGPSSSPKSMLFDLLTPGPARPSSPASTYTTHPERAAEVRAILDKAAEPQWETAIRYGLATSPCPPVATAHGSETLRQARRRLRRPLRGRAHAVASAYALFTAHNYLDRRRLRRVPVVLSRRWLRRGDLLSVTELAALAHLPADPAVPGLARAGARTVPPPPMIPAPGPHTKPLGISDAGDRRPVGLGVAGSRHHLHLLGATGSGKSTLLAQMILADVTARRGAAVWDPKGDLVRELLGLLPEHAASRVVLVDPDEHVRPTLNVLQGPDRDLVADNLVGIFSRIFADNWGPRTDDILRSACLTLWHTQAATIADIPRLLSDASYRAARTSRLRDPILTDFWAWYDTLSAPARANATGPVLNKLRAFLLRDFIRATIGAGTSTIDLGHVLNNGGLLLIRAPKGELGADAAGLFGSLILAKVWETVSNRARHSQDARPDAALYIDEAHNFLTLPHSLGDLLAEARGYHLSVTLAHHDLAQLPRDLRDAIAVNARNKIYFAVSPGDARDLARHVAPNLTDHDLAHLGAYQATARLIVDAAETPAFTLTTRPLPPPIPGRAELIRRVARESHGYTPTTGTGPYAPPGGDPRIPTPPESSQTP